MRLFLNAIPGQRLASNACKLNFSDYLRLMHHGVISKCINHNNIFGNIIANVFHQEPLPGGRGTRKKRKQKFLISLSGSKYDTLLANRLQLAVDKRHRVREGSRLMVVCSTGTLAAPPACMSHLLNRSTYLSQLDYIVIITCLCTSFHHIF